MKTTCNLIKDLLPLYVDKICSDESARIVSEHLAVCENCKEEYRLMSSDSEFPHISDDEQNIIKASSFAWKKRKRQSFAIGCVAFAIITALGIASFVTIHWFSSADNQNTALLIKQAENYFNYEISNVLDIDTRGNYLAIVYKTKNGDFGMCQFDKDEFFHNRFKASGGKPNFSAGEIVSWNYTSSENEAVLIFTGAHLPQGADYYTFENSNTTYICPIENEIVLDIFVIQNSNNINSSPQLLDSNKNEIK